MSISWIIEEKEHEALLGITHDDIVCVCEITVEKKARWGAIFTHTWNNSVNGSGHRELEGKHMIVQEYSVDTHRGVISGQLEKFIGEHPDLDYVRMGGDELVERWEAFNTGEVTA